MKGENNIMNESFDFKDLLKFGEFLIGLLAFMYTICH